MSAGAGDRRRPTQAGTAPALMPGDDPFALSAVPMFCFINASFCRVPWTCGAALVYFSTSLRAQDETPRALPQGMLYSLFPGLVVSRRETPETSSPRPPTLCGTRQAHFCNQPGVFLNFFFYKKQNLINQVSWYTSLHSMIHEARGLVYSLTQGSMFASWYKVPPHAQGSPCRMGTLFCCPKSTLLCGHWGKELLN